MKKHKSIFTLNRIIWFVVIITSANVLFFTPMFIGEDSLFMNAKTKEDEFFGLIKPDDKNREIKQEILNSCKQVYSAMGCTPETTFKWDIEAMFNRINNTKVKFTWAPRETAVPVTHCHELYKVECMEMLYQAYESNNITCQYKPHVDLIPNEEENILLQKIPKSTADYPRAKPFSGTKVRIAYSILVHGNTEMFARLMRLLYHPDNFYSLCIDKSVDDNEYETFKRIAEKYSVYIIPERFDVMWGHPTLMYAQYISLLALMDLGEWDYFINLSGADLPLKSQPEISDFLVKNMGMSFMHNRKLINGDLIEAGELYITCIEDQIDFPHMVLDGNIPYGNIHPPHNFTWYFGWNWMILSKNATLFLKYHPFSHDVIRKSKYIYIADEKTFHTILKNAPELEGLIDINYHRYINWTLNAHVIIPEYLPIIQNENQTDLFARKFKNDEVAVQFENWFIENKETFTP